MVAIVTPLGLDGQLDLAAWDRLLEFHVSEGSDGIVVGGTTGESPALSLEEIETLTDRAVSRCRGRMRVLVGVGTNSTAGTVARTHALSRLGVDGVMVVTPYYNKPPQEGLYRHFMAVADASAVPLVLYNVPGRTGVDLMPATIARLAAHPSIVAVKEATGSLVRGREVMAACGPGFALLSGDDATSIALMGIGARGVISVTANVTPRRMHEACAAALRQDMSAAKTVDATLQPLHRDLFVEASPIPVKWAVAQLGLIGPTLRLPLVDLTPAHHDTIRRAMQAAGIELKDQAA
jgi:4-hydroxy-tetrahydrodipicolinate synthase